MSGLGAPEGGGGRAELAVGIGEMHGCPFSVAGGSGVLQISREKEFPETLTGG